MADTQELSIKQKLSKIQVELKAPKSQYNNFGKYPYRNVEDIQEGLKPLLAKYDCSVITSDTIVEKEYHGQKELFVVATATLMDDTGDVSVTSSAKLDEVKKGMDAAQLTGSTSSYARKYALGGLFAVDDTKDADSHDNRPAPAKTNPKTAPAAIPPLKTEKITNAQLGLIYATMKDKGYANKDEVTDTLHKLVSVKSLSELTKAQATNLATFLKDSDKDAIDAAKSKVNS